MTIQEFYKRCEQHDWYCAYSDDYSVVRRGEANYAGLKELASKDPERKAVLDAWHSYMFTGSAWGTERAPKPVCPS